MSWSSFAAGSPVLPLGLTIASLAVAWTAFLLARRKLAGTTLTVPWSWHLATTTVVGIAGCWGVGRGWALAPSFQPLQFACAVGTFCPTMALLGAKRPQDRAWSFIVASLWGVLALPALEVAVLHPGQSLLIRDLRGWFLWILIAAELANRLGTRLWLVGLLQACGQFVLLSEHLPLVRATVGAFAWPLGTGACAAAVAVSAWHYRRRRPHGVSMFDRIWLDYRDWFGVLWSLRVAERINAVARTNQWTVHLGWTGFQNRNGQAGAGEDPMANGLRQALVNVLRRFVSDGWLHERGW